MSNEEAFVTELIGYIFTYIDDDYMTMECLCRKLYKHGLIEKKDGEWTCNFITPQTEIDKVVCPNCGRSDYIRSFEKDFSIKNSEYRYKCINCNTYIKDTPLTEKPKIRKRVITEWRLDGKR